MASILDKNFKYTRSEKTDIRKLFRRIESERKAKEQSAKQSNVSVISVVKGRK